MNGREDPCSVVQHTDGGSPHACGWVGVPLTQPLGRGQSHRRKPILCWGPDLTLEVTFGTEGALLSQQTLLHSWGRCPDLLVVSPRGRAHGLPLLTRKQRGPEPRERGCKCVPGRVCGPGGGRKGHRLPAHPDLPEPGSTR